MTTSIKYLKLGQTMVVGLNQEYYKNYGPGGYAKNYKWFGFDLPGILNTYRRNKVYPTSLLDAGCADGRTVVDFRRHGIDARGIAIANYMFSVMSQAARPYCQQLDIRDIHQLGSNYVDSIYANSLMYLKEPEIHSFLKDAHNVAKRSLYLITPFSDYPDSIPKDQERKTLKTRRWWLDTVPEYGWSYCPGTNMLFRK